MNKKIIKVGLSLFLISSLQAATQIPQPEKTNNSNKTKETKKQLTEKQKKVLQSWENNPLKCYKDVSMAFIPKCIDQKHSVFKCQAFVIDKVNKFCEKPTLISIKKSYEEKFKTKIDLSKEQKELPQDFKKYLQDSLILYHKEAIFFTGMNMGYYLSIKNNKKLFNKIEQKNTEVKDDKK